VYVRSSFTVVNLHDLRRNYPDSISCGIGLVYEKWGNLATCEEDDLTCTRGDVSEKRKTGMRMTERIRVVEGHTNGQKLPGSSLFISDSLVKW